MDNAHTGYSVLDVRVAAIENGFSSLSKQIESLAIKISDKGKVDWTAIGVVISALTVIGVLVYWPIKEAQSRINDDIRAITQIALPKDVYQDRHEALRSTMADRATADETRMDRIAAGLGKLTDQVVPRVEHEKEWVAAKDRAADVQRQLDELKRLYSDIYSPKDEIRRIEQQLEELDQRIRSAPK